ncbi:uncharacterized protein LOC125381595 [Haliotis rufescens]|uniref:uncharacterized protein LOC125381595 n=1 Tax=Haliotis rufescens TaxID=6454 RepID=UPI00201EC3E8|nr:uncharacterized protein LOC125381595 [Haliotis rufescens]
MADNELDNLWASAVSHRTYEVYQAGFKAYALFIATCSSIWSSSLPPISEELLLRFVAHCHKHQNLRYATIKTYLCGVRFMYLKAGVPNPWTLGNLTRLHTIVGAVKRQQGCTVYVRLPITSSILTKLCHLLDQGVFTSSLNIMLKAVCCLAFFAFLRCGEFTCDRFSPHVNLCFNSVKTDPFRKGVNIVLHRMNTAICPVHNMLTYMYHRKQSGTSPHDPLFVSPSGSALSRKFFIQCLKTLLSMAGYDDKAYNGHSFRIGAATSAASKGVPDHMIQTLGRWTSACYTRYIRTSQVSIRKAQIAMAQK